jgi:hypothetical protein
MFGANEAVQEWKSLLLVPVGYEMAGQPGGVRLAVPGDEVRGLTSRPALLLA